MASQDTITLLTSSVQANSAAVNAAVTALNELQASVTDLTAKAADLETQVTSLTAQVEELSVQIGTLTAANAVEDQSLVALAASIDANNTLLASAPVVSTAPAPSDTAP